MLFISVIPISILYFFNYKVSNSIYLTQVTDTGNKETEQKTVRLQNSLENIQDIMTALIFSTYDGQSCFLNIAKEESENNSLTLHSRLANQRAFEYVTQNLIGTEKEIDAVYIFNENGYTYQYVKGNELGLEKNYEEQDWYQEILNSKNFEAVKMIHSLGHEGHSLIVGRAFISGNARSVLAVACNDEIFQDLAGNLPTYLLDEETNIIYENSQDDLPKDVVEKISEENINKSGLIRDGDSSHAAFAFRNISESKWTIVSRISLDEINKIYILNKQILAAIILLLAVFIIVVLFLWEYKVIRPILNLSQIMQHIHDFKGIEDENTKRNDEIGILYRGYQEMLQRINRLVDERYLSEIKYLNSRLQNLMGQINAHFIFNTLENIVSLAWIEGNQQIGTMAKALGDILRYSIDYEKDEEMLQSEVNHVKQYIKIQEIKFDNTIHLEEVIEPGLYKAKVPKFLFQPIIENSIEHGMVGNEDEWRLIIKASHVNNNVILLVEDNGCGMSDKKLMEIRKRIEQKSDDLETSQESIGLININQRIQLLYGNDYGLNVEKLSNRGIRIIINIPYHI